MASSRAIHFDHRALNGRDGSPSRPTSRAKRSGGGWLSGVGVVAATTSSVSIRDVLAKRPYPLGRFAEPSHFTGEAERRRLAFGCGRRCCNNVQRFDQGRFGKTSLPFDAKPAAFTTASRFHSIRRKVWYLFPSSKFFQFKLTSILRCNPLPHPARSLFPS